MMMDVWMDTGDMLEKGTVAMDEKETYGSIHDKLSVLDVYKRQPCRWWASPEAWGRRPPGR